MFTLKFIRYESEGDGATTSKIETCVSVPNYQVHRRGYFEVITVTAFPTLFDTDGVVRHISDEPKEYDCCYVENEEGKTIDHIRHSDSPVERPAA